MSAGWGRPVNRHHAEPIHWWSNNDNTACGDSGGWSFAGRKIPGHEIHADEVCVDCLVAVRKVFGFPGSQPGYTDPTITSINREDISDGRTKVQDAGTASDRGSDPSVGTGSDH